VTFLVDKSALIREEHGDRRPPRDLATIPFSAATFEVQPWLTATISPLAAFRWQPELTGGVLEHLELRSHHASSGWRLSGVRGPLLTVNLDVYGAG
jgi:hypothetical protein